MKNLILALSLTLPALALTTAFASEGHHHPKLPANGRTGLHGMVVYGSNGTYFLDHIPMNHAPHDFQVIAEVSLTHSSGQPVKVNLSQGAFTIKPDDQFSLNNFINGQLRTFSGELFTGSFEQDGKLVPGLEKINVVIKQISYSRQLPGSSTKKFLQFTAGLNTFQINVITPTQNFQAIKNLTTGEFLWCVKGPDFFEPC